MSSPYEIPIYKSEPLAPNLRRDYVGECVRVEALYNWRYWYETVTDGSSDNFSETISMLLLETKEQRESK
jgi:hypothetical protein